MGVIGVVDLNLLNFLPLHFLLYLTRIRSNSPQNPYLLADRGILDWFGMWRLCARLSAKHHNAFVPWGRKTECTDGRFG